jgi:hypothetical protein
MDVISHGLWGGGAFGRKNKKYFLYAFLIGMAPDAFSFGILMVANIFGIIPRSDWHAGPPPMESVPHFISPLYNFTHSLVIFSAVFCILLIISKKPFWPLAAWGLHILVDIPSHSFKFFPTPFLWPISNFKINGIGWGNPIIFIPNVILLAILYSYLLYKKKKATKI